MKPFSTTNCRRPHENELKQCKHTMADPFANLLVRINDRPIYCMGVKGALSPGNWVLFKRSGIEEEDDMIGLILSTADDGNLMEVNVFRRITLALSQALKLPKFNNPRYQHMP